MKFKKGDTVIYPQHGACIVMGTKKMEAFGEKREYLILQTVINEMTLKVPVNMAEEVGVRPPVSADELEDLVAVLSKPDPRVPSNWSRRFKNHQEKLKSGDVYQVAEVVRNLAARNRDAVAVGRRAHDVRAGPCQPGQRDLAGAQGVGRGGRGVPRRRPRQGRPQAGQAASRRPPRRSSTAAKLAGIGCSAGRPPVADRPPSAATASTMRSIWRR